MHRTKFSPPPNSLKAKNKDKALEEVELEPELEKVEEQPIVSKS
jgi:hypothetical protein